MTETTTTEEVTVFATDATNQDTYPATAENLILRTTDETDNLVAANATIAKATATLPASAMQSAKNTPLEAELATNAMKKVTLPVTAQP